MSDPVELYRDDDIRIHWDFEQKYVLTTPDSALFCQQQVVRDADGATVLSFEPENERFWDAKLILGRKPMIGRAVCGEDSFEVRVQGLKTQKVLLGEAHTITRQGGCLQRGEAFDFHNIHHLALLLLLAEKMDRR